MKVADLDRSLAMAMEAVAWSKDAHEKESERNAALHMQTKVMYSPVVVALDEALTKLGAIRLELVDGKAAEGEVTVRP